MLANAAQTVYAGGEPTGAGQSDGVIAKFSLRLPDTLLNRNTTDSTK
jgi:hypothetical protein